MDYEVTMKESAPTTVLTMRRQVRVAFIGDDISDGMRELYDQATAAGLRPTGPPAITYLGEFGAGPTNDVEFTVPVQPSSTSTPAGDIEVVRKEPAMVACTLHRGDYEKVGAAYQALEEWIRTSGSRAVGPPTEVYLVGPDEATGPHELLTEVRIPVTAGS